MAFIAKYSYFLFFTILSVPLADPISRPCDRVGFPNGGYGRRLIRLWVD